jgi:hypothetical protein
MWNKILAIIRREFSAVPVCRPVVQRIHTSKNNAVHSQQHILTQL